MISYLKELFSENSNASVARVGFILCYLSANIIAVYSACASKENTALVATLLSAGTVLKIGQKSLEGKND